MDTTADFAVALLTQYSFDLSGYTAHQLVNGWLNDYPANWIYQGVIEALYQGRYKAVSVAQLLAAWNRRGEVLYHFNHEFERLICSKLPKKQTESPQTSIPLSPSAPDSLQHQDQRDRSVVTAGTSHSSTNHSNTNHSNTLSEQVSPIPNLTFSTSQGREEVTERKMHQVIEANQKASPKSDNRLPIRQFTPATDPSDLYTKLRAMAQQLGN